MEGSGGWERGSKEITFRGVKATHPFFVPVPARLKSCPFKTSHRPGLKAELFGGGERELNPVLLMTVITEDIARDPAGCVVFEGELHVMCSCGIDGTEEGVGRLGLETDYIATGASLKKLVPLADDGLYGMAVGFAILAGERVELCTCELDCGREKGNDEAFGKDLRVGRKAVSQQPHW